MTPEEELQWLIDNGYMEDNSDRDSDKSSYVDGSQLDSKDHEYHEGVGFH